MSAAVSGRSVAARARRQHSRTVSYEVKVTNPMMHGRRGATAPSSGRTRPSREGLGGGLAYAGPPRRGDGRGGGVTPTAETRTPPRQVVPPALGLGGVRTGGRLYSGGHTTWMWMVR